MALQRVHLAAVLSPPRPGRVWMIVSLGPRLLRLLVGPRELSVLQCWCPELEVSSLCSLCRLPSVRGLCARSRLARQLSAGSLTWAIWPRRSAATVSGACDFSASPQVTIGCGCEAGALGRDLLQPHPPVSRRPYCGQGHSMLMHPRASAGVMPCSLQLLGLCPCHLQLAPRRGGRRKAGRGAVGRPSGVVGPCVLALVSPGPGLPPPSLLASGVCVFLSTSGW